MTLIAGNLILDSTPDPFYDGNQQPSLDLRFAEGKNLNDYVSATPLVDHQRSMSGSNLSAGTFVNSSGLIEEAKTNIIKYSELQVGWFFRNTTSTPGQSSPDGLSSAVLVAETTSTTNHYLNRDDVSVTAGNTYCLSVYLKKGNGATAPQWMTLFTNGSGFGGGDAYMASFDIQNGVKGSAGVSIIDFDIIDAGGGWYRCWIAATATATVSDTSLAVVFNNNQSAVLPVQVYTGQTTSNVFVFGAQVEEGSFPSTYIPTTNVPSAAPRFDHNPTTGESLGLLIEESRTNAIDYSETFSAPLWSNVPLGTGSNPQVTSSAEASPGLTSPTRLVCNLNGGTTSGDISYIQKTSTYTANQTGTIYLKSNTGSNQQVYFRIGTTVSIVTVTPTWQRFEVKETSFSGGGNFNIGTRGGTGSDDSIDILIWGAQLEAGSFPTSYIPTAGTALTRSADTASITGTNFSSWYNQSAGSAFIETVPKNYSLADLFMFGTNKSFNPSSWGTYQPGANNDYQFYGRISSAYDFNASINNSDAASKLSFGLSGTTYSASYDGNTVTTGSNSGVPTGINTLEFNKGVYGISSIYVKRFTYFPDRLPDATLQAITA